MLLLLFGITIYIAFPLYFTQGIMPAWAIWCLEVSSLIMLFLSDNKTVILISSILSCLLPGIAMGGMIFGLDRLGAMGGLGLLGDWRCIVAGLATLLMCFMGGALWIDRHKGKGHTMRITVLSSGIPFSLLLLVMIWLLASGNAQHQTPDGFDIVPYAHLDNMARIWWSGLGLSAGIVAINAVIMAMVVQGHFKNGYIVWCAGVALIVVSIFAIIGLNGVSYLPDPTAPDNSLSLANSSSSTETLQTVAYISAAAASVGCAALWRHFRR